MRKMSSDTNSDTLTLHGAAMGTHWSVRGDIGADGDTQALRQDLALAVERVDAQMSPWKPDSDLLRLNHAAPRDWVSLPEDILTVLARAMEISRLSGGAFDPGVGALVDAWGFGAARTQPDAAAIRQAAQGPRRPAHDSLELDLAAGRARKHEPMQLDLCGIAKGYAVDRMADILRSHGVAHALASIDGELRAIGPKPDGKSWAVAVERPEPGRRAVHGVIEITDMAIATSGDYRRSVSIGDTRLSHSMDGRRAAPVQNAVASVSVLAGNCMDADAWATALLVAGPEDGPALAQRMGLDALFLLRKGGGLVEMGLGRFA